MSRPSRRSLSRKLCFSNDLPRASKQVFDGFERDFFGRPVPILRNKRRCRVRRGASEFSQAKENYRKLVVHANRKIASVSGLATRGPTSELPDACDDDDDYGYWYDDDYSYDFSYWYNDDWYVDDAPNVLQLVEVAVRDPEDCVLEYLPGFDICAGDPPAEDSCYGDSGGPLLVREGDAWAQVGVVSRGEGCAAFPGLYADATALREWILSTAAFGEETAPSARPTVRSVPQSTPPTQESSPTSRPTEPSATPDDPLGLPEESPAAAPTAESDAALGRRLAWAAAACALAALLL